MLNSISRLFRSMLQWFRPARRIPEEPAISPEQFRKMLQQTLTDPEQARLLLRSLVGTAFPIQGATCSNASDIGGSSTNDKTFGYNCSNPDFYFPSKLGIGTTSPAGGLHVKSTGSVQPFFEASSGNRVMIHSLITGVRDWVFGTDGADSNKFKISSADDAFASARLTLQTDGNVGIGTTAPLGKLQIGTLAGGEPTYRGDVIINQSAVTEASTAGLEFKPDNSGPSSSGYGSRILNVFDGNNAYDLRFQNRTDSPTWSTKMTLTAAGNVGIGTTGPLSKLDVNGGAAVGSYAGSNAAPSNGLIVSGNVGIGATSPGEKLEVNGNIKISASSGKGIIFEDGSVQTTAPVSSGADNYVPVFDGTDALAPSTILQDGDNIEVGKLNQIVFLKPTGSNDHTQIQDAIDGLPKGGIIMLEPAFDGSGNPIAYDLASKLTVDHTGIKIRSYGGTDPGSGLPLVSLKWNSSATAGETMLELKAAGTNTQIQDLELSDLTIDGNNRAGIGLVLDRILNSKFLNVRVRNVTGTPSVGVNAGIKLTTTADGGTDHDNTYQGDNIGTSWNHFENCSIFGGTNGLQLTSETTGTSGSPPHASPAVANTCHNTFVSLNIQGCTGSGILLSQCDNNSFYRTLTPGTATNGVLVEDPTTAYSNYFYHLQPGGATYGVKVEKAHSPSLVYKYKNMFFGYDLANDENPPSAFDTTVTPVVDVNATDFLFWTDSKGTTYTGGVGANPTDPHLGMAIGTATPTMRLTVADTGANSQMNLVGGASILEFWKDGGTVPSKAAAIGLASPGSAAGNDLALSTWDGSAWSRRVTIRNSDGNLGIGDANPGEKLVVNGNVSVSGIKISGSATSGEYLRGNGTIFTSSEIQEADIPHTLNTYLNTVGGARLRAFSQSSRPTINDEETAWWYRETDAKLGLIRRAGSQYTFAIFASFEDVS